MAISENQLSDLYDATVVSTTDGKVGKVGTVYLDDDTQQPSWVTVKTGLFGSSESFVPLDAAELSGDEVRVSYSKDQVKDAPRMDTDSELTPEEEDELYRYYGLRRGGDDAGTRDAGTAGTSTVGTGSPGAGGGGTAARSGTDADASTTGTAGSGAPGHADGRDDARTTGGSATGQRASGAGHDTSGPDTDDAMTRSEERVSFGTQQRESGRARLRKHVVSDRVSEDVAVSREEAVVEREPITDANRGDAVSGGDLTEEEHEVTLHEERAVVDKETVPVERVRLGTETVADTETVSADRRREEIEVDGDATDGGTAGRGTGDADRR
ncbi:PRC and DUF2382 domain-containing protein [uncultured Pseudokineococcus sp.]|uniref:PRC and DUF2382 domain-containing protein n=1 Tax=uncultured Pseudokineococcus sp. TaxID=1642928 RepID=UPI00260FCC2D|nr:PRC and DUF2382 domain-containing protein [uncultured Pseudokineococcus sp.]